MTLIEFDANSDDDNIVLYWRETARNASTAVARHLSVCLTVARCYCVKNSRNNNDRWNSVMYLAFAQIILVGCHRQAMCFPILLAYN